MNFNLNEEQKMIRDMVRHFAENEIKPVADQLDRSGEFPTEIMKKLSELGVLGIPIPEEYGGIGSSFLSYIVAIEELSRACASTGVIVETHTSLGSEPILDFGTEEQKRKYLPRLASGQIIGSFGLTESNAGSDAAGMQTFAVIDGDDYVINGSKIFISNAGIADLTILFAKTDKEKGVKGISAFIVEKNTLGYIVGPPEDKLGIRASQTCALTFEDMRIPRENLLGKVNEGFKIAMHTLDGGRIAIAAQALGIAQAAFEAASEYSKQRVQFGQPIGKLQGIQWHIADMATEIQAARLLTYQAAWLKDQGLRYTKEAAMAKLFASEAASRFTSRAIQVHGGYGFMMEYPVQRHYRDAKITEIYEGTSEIQRMVIANNVLFR
ncbi:MAG: acyl-CoA dehydrogenase [Clostridiaceae bacterium BRH_c20a]|nr:MAG: acyl-CoA dehydrogenase [Clostridiaceae bacterium BRH_c20a]